MCLRNIYTDGGCRYGTGAWGFVVVEKDDVTQQGRGHVLDTTNNRMEMMAVIEAIKSQEPGHEVRIYSDSSYLVNGYNDPSYLKKWMLNGWQTSRGGAVENQDLWRELLSLSKTHRFRLIHIKGHGKDKNQDHHKWNTLVDQICTEVISVVTADQELRTMGEVFDA